MATVHLDIGGRRYPISCRDGEEASLQEAARLVDRRATDAASMLGQLSESQLLLFTALMLADDLKEAVGGGQSALPLAAEPPQPGIDPAILTAIAARLEAIAEKVAPNG